MEKEKTKGFQGFRGVPFAFREVFPTVLKYTNTWGDFLLVNVFFWCEITNLPSLYPTQRNIKKQINDVC